MAFPPSNLWFEDTDVRHPAQFAVAAEPDPIQKLISGQRITRSGRRITPRDITVVPPRCHDACLGRKREPAGDLAMSGSPRGLKPMHRRMTLSCVVLAAALMGSAGVARPVECHSEKGAGYPWAWRQ